MRKRAVIQPSGAMRGCATVIERAIELQDGVNLKVLFSQIRQGIDLLIEPLRVERGCDFRRRVQSKVPLGNRDVFGSRGSQPRMGVLQRA